MPDEDGRAVWIASSGDRRSEAAGNQAWHLLFGCREREACCGEVHDSRFVATPGQYNVERRSCSFTAGGTIGAPAVLTQGAPGKDFADAGTGSCTTNGTTHVYAAGDTCTVDVTFTPMAAGERYGAAVLQNSSGTTIATGYVQGMGLGPQAGFPPGTQTTLPFSNLNPFAIATDASGNLYIAEGGTVGRNSVVKETWTGSGYTQSTVASGLRYPVGVAVDSSGNIYACSDEANTAWKIDLADPPALSFASTSFDSISSDSPKAVTLANIGNAPLTFPAPGTGNNPAISSHFSLDSSGSSACPLIGSGSPAGTLASGASCQLSITFAPVAVGALNGSLRVTDNDLNAAAPAYASQRILLSGTAVRAMPTITWTTPAAIPYGTALSTTQLNATASVPGTFAYSPALGAVLSAGSQTLSVTFTPTDTTDYTTATSAVTLAV